MFDEIPENDGNTTYKYLVNVYMSKLLLYWNLKKNPMHHKILTTMENLQMRMIWKKLKRCSQLSTREISC